MSMIVVLELNKVKNGKPFSIYKYTKLIDSEIVLRRKDEKDT